MNDFPNALTDLTVSLSSEGFAFESFRQALNGVFQTIPLAAPEELDAGLHRLRDLIDGDSPILAGGLAMCAGAVVENGGDPLTVLPVLFEQLPVVLRDAAAFADACREEGGEDSEDDTSDPVETHGRAVAAKRPRQADAWSAVRHLSLGTIAMLSRSREARRRAREHPELLALSRELDAVGFGGGSSFLTKLLRVLDDEPLLVIHPEEKRGYRLRLSGVATNFELFVLLGDALIGDPDAGWLHGERTDPAVIAAFRDQPASSAKGKGAVAAFNFWNWQGLESDGRLPDAATSPADHWVWMEGVPADVQPFEGLRVVLLGPPPYVRSFGAGRCFEGMRPEIKVETHLAEAEVAEWLSKLSTAPRPSAGVG